MRRLAAITVLLAALVAGAFAASGAGHGDGPYRVRAIFDNASFVVDGLDVKAAGVRIGRIDGLGVTEDDRAAVTLAIEDPAFQDFRADATCRIRPASLIGEEFVDCAPTQPRAPGTPLPPPLERLESGEFLLPVENTSASVDLDLIAEATRRPQRERLALILGELGVGLAARGPELNEVIRRANPALGQTSRVLELLAAQNDELAQLARDSDAIMAPLARERERVSGFVARAGETAQATAERREALRASLQRLPRFLRELRPTMDRLEGLTAAMTPVAADLRAGAPQINQLVAGLGPLAEAGRPALLTLGDAAEPGIPALRGALPILGDLRTFGRGLRPVAGTLAEVLESFERNEGVENVMDFLFFTAMATNGFDEFGHFLRASLIVNVCSTYAIAPVGGCSANFRQDTARAASAVPSEGARKQAALLRGADPREVLTREERREGRRQREALLDYLLAEGGR